LSGAASAPVILGGCIDGGLVGLLIGAIGGAKVEYQLSENHAPSTPIPVPLTHTDSPVVTTINDGAKDISATPTTPTVSDTPINLNQLGRIRIVLKDGTTRKSCLIREIREGWITYEKDGVLHDLEISKILRLETSGISVPRNIMFDKDNALRLSGD